MRPIKNRLIQLTATLGAVVSLAGCRIATEKDIPGLYVMKRTWGESTLDLRVDHTMAQEFKRKGEEPLRVVGTWDYKEHYVGLDPCIRIREDEPAMIITCGFAAEVGPLGTEIAISSASGLAYTKVERTDSR